MSVRYSVVVSDELNNELERIALESRTDKGELLRKAVQLFLAAREGRRQGLRVGLVEPETEQMQTEFIGL